MVTNMWFRTDRIYTSSAAGEDSPISEILRTSPPHAVIQIVKKKKIKKKSKATGTGILVDFIHLDLSICIYMDISQKCA